MLLILYCFTGEVGIEVVAAGNESLHKAALELLEWESRSTSK